MSEAAASAFDAGRPFRTRDGDIVTDLRIFADGFSGYTHDFIRLWHADGREQEGRTGLDLVNDPVPVAPALAEGETHG